MDSSNAPPRIAHLRAFRICGHERCGPAFGAQTFDFAWATKARNPARTIKPAIREYQTLHRMSYYLLRLLEHKHCTTIAVVVLIAVMLMAVCLLDCRTELLFLSSFLPDHRRFHYFHRRQDNLLLLLLYRWHIIPIL